MPNRPLSLKQIVNKLKHMRAQYDRLYDELTALCPEEYRAECARVDEDDDVGRAWQTAHAEIGEIIVPLCDLIYELQPPEFDDDDEFEDEE